MTEPQPRVERLPADEDEDAGGESACALHRVCDGCGALEQGPTTPVCGRCGATRAG